MVPGPDPDREIYPNTPLKLVACEYRFEPVELSESQAAKFTSMLVDEYPVGGPPQQQVTLGPTGPIQGLHARAFGADRRASVAISPQSLIVETAKYRRFEDFRDAVGRALGTLVQLGFDVVPVRFGLRYIDEIDETLLTDGGWGRYIDSALAAPLTHFDPTPTEHQSAALFEFGDGIKVVLRYGLMRQPAVDPAGPLVIDNPPRGRYYLIDIDSAWERTREGQTDHSLEWALDTLTSLHAPVRRLFESSITESLRDDVLRKEQ